MPEPRAFASRAYVPVLLGLAVAVLGTQLLALAASFEHNPFARSPLMDAEVYWAWAGAIARGELQGDAPFSSAPFYPYLLGLLRTLGLGLHGVTVVQIGLHVATGLLIARAGRTTFGPGVGLTAALLYFLLSDPAYTTGRILSGTAVLFLTSLTLVQAQALSARPGTGRAALLGFLSGVLCTAHPPMLLALPPLALWSAWQSDGGRWIRGLATGLLALLAIAPATAHNFAASGEFIPISSQAGITFYHGNQPGADGTYTVASGVSTDREQQNIDALDRARRETGSDRWNDVNRFYFRKGLAFWKEEPGQAAALFLRKAYWFLTGRVYGDIYLPALEDQRGLPTQARFAPLPLALLTWTGLLAIVLLLRDPRRHLPLVLLAAVPLLVVCVFWYSPRYRLPAVPPLVVATAFALSRASDLRTRPGRAGPLLASLVAAGLALWINVQRGFDRPATYLPAFDYTLGILHLNHGELDRARAPLERARDANHARASVALADLLRRQRNPAAAIPELQRAVELAPGDAYAQRSLATALAEAGRIGEARVAFETSLALDPNNWSALNGLGNVDLMEGRVERAMGRYRRALELDPDFGEARFNLAMALARHCDPPRIEEALTQVREALRREPDHPRYLEALEWLEGRP